MRKAFATAATLLMIAGTLLGQGKKIQAIVSYTTFYLPDESPYIEVYTAVNAKSVCYAPLSNGKFQATVNVNIDLVQDDSIFQSLHYQLLSAEVADTNLAEDFIDVRRLALPNGIYAFCFSISDLIGKTKPITYQEPLLIDFPKDSIVCSGIQLLDTYAPATTQTAFTKNGFDMIPYLNDFYGEDRDQLVFYAEIYNSDKQLGTNADCLLRTYIENFDEHSLLTNYITNRRKKSADIIPVLQAYNLTNLPSGNYNLVVELLNRENELVATNKFFFQRSNPSIKLDTANLYRWNVAETFAGKITDEKVLKDYIQSLYPISTGMDKTFILESLKKASLDLCQHFFYDFWERRDNLAPEQAWLAYKLKVETVNATYGTAVRKGYQTDQGRVYLQYGAPNTISSQRFDPSSYPYEIWHYYNLTPTQGNKKFVFYNRNFATKDYELLHSDAIGEIYDPTWQVKLQKRLNPETNHDVKTIDPYWGGKANQLWNEPY